MVNGLKVLAQPQPNAPKHFSEPLTSGKEGAMSDIQKTIQTLRDFNLWRKGDDAMEQPDPWGIGEAIDEAIEAMEELNEWRTLMSWGGTPEIINDFIKGQQSRIYAAQEAEEQRDSLAEVAQAVWDRWETPLWKDHPPTALVMNKLRDALTAVEGGRL
jgi:hypothetical protein